MTLNSKHSQFAHWQPQNSSPSRQRKGKQQEMTKACLGLMSVVLSLSNYADPYFLV